MPYQNILTRNTASGTDLKETRAQSYSRTFGYNIMEAMALLADSNEVGALTTKRVGNRKYNVVGTLTNTFFNEPAGTAPSTNITSGSTSIEVLQRYDSSYAMEDSDLSLLRPLVWIDSGGKTGFKQATDDDLNDIIDGCLNNHFGKGAPYYGLGGYFLSQTVPSTTQTGDSAGIFTGKDIITDTRGDGTSDTYKLWRRTNASAGGPFVNAIPFLSNNNYRPLYVEDSGSNFAIREMSDQQQRKFVKLAQRRIQESGIGKYQIRSSAQGTPTDPGTWVSRGTFTDTKLTTQDIGYTSTFVSNYQKDYVSGYEAIYVGVYTGAYQGGPDTVYGMDYSNVEYNVDLRAPGNIGYQTPSQYYQGVGYYIAASYIGAWSPSQGNAYYDLSFTGQYDDDAQNYLAAPTYARFHQVTAFAGNYDIQYEREYIADYAREFTVASYTRTDMSAYASQYITTYVKEFTGLYGESYIGTYTADVPYVLGTQYYLRQYTGTQYTGFLAYDAGSPETGDYIIGAHRYGNDGGPYYIPNYDITYTGPSGQFMNTYVADNEADQYYWLTFIGAGGPFYASYARHTITPDYYPNYETEYAQDQYLGTNYYVRDFSATYIGPGAYPVYTRPRLGQPSYPGWTGVMGFWPSNVQMNQGYVPGDDSLDTNSYYMGASYMRWGTVTYYGGSVRNSNPLYFGNNFIGAGGNPFIGYFQNNFINPDAGLYYTTGFGPTEYYLREYVGPITFGLNSYQGSGGTYQQYYESVGSIAGLLYASEGPAYVRDIGSFNAFYTAIPQYTRVQYYTTNYTREFGQLYTGEFEQGMVLYQASPYYDSYAAVVYYGSSFFDEGQALPTYTDIIVGNVRAYSLIAYGEIRYDRSAYLNYYQNAYEGPAKYILGPDDHFYNSYQPAYEQSGTVSHYDRAYQRLYSGPGGGYARNFMGRYQLTGTTYVGKTEWHYVGLNPNNPQIFAAGDNPYIGPLYMGGYVGPTGSYLGNKSDHPDVLYAGQPLTISYGSDQYQGPVRYYGSGSSDPEGYEGGYLIFSRLTFMDAYQWPIDEYDHQMGTIYNPGGSTYIGAPDYFGVTYLREYVHGDSPSYLGLAYLASGYVTHYTAETPAADGGQTNTYIKTTSKSYESLGKTVEYGVTYIGDYAGDFDGFFDGAEFNVFYESAYEKDYVKDYINHFLGETIQATSSDIETYTLYVRIS